ncbi:MAG: hypothetical protein FWC03_09945 [Treponema sp.]|nr:hypothetical protein [Treponema sp.]
MKKLFLILVFIPVFTFAESLYSPTWGFKIDLPEGYEYMEGDGRNQFSFLGPKDAIFDLIVYNGVYKSMRELVNDINNRLKNIGDIDFFIYNNKQAAIIELDFGDRSGWGFCVELNGSTPDSLPPMLLALAYGPANLDLNLYHLSALDSLIPSDEDQFYPGPIMEYSYPRGAQKRVFLPSGGANVIMYENDAEAAQALIEREYNILTCYASSGNWQNAWIRYYRMIYRDSIDRITNAASIIVRSWGGPPSSGIEERRAFAQRALDYVQNFNYERDLSGSDFLNLVTAVTEGRGDCDSRVMLWAIILAHADIRCAMMVSNQHSHAMGLADLPGTGARFEAYGVNWLVAETTAKINIGLIAQDMSNPVHWLGIIFE